MTTLRGDVDGRLTGRGAAGLGLEHTEPTIRLTELPKLRQTSNRHTKSARKAAGSTYKSLCQANNELIPEPSTPSETIQASHLPKHGVACANESRDACEMHEGMLRGRFRAVVIPRRRVTAGLHAA